MANYSATKLAKCVDMKFSSGGGTDIRKWVNNPKLYAKQSR